MVAIRINESAAIRLDEIYQYSRKQWGEEKADQYIRGLFEAIENIKNRPWVSRPIPAEFGVDGYFFRYEKHFIYWRRFKSGEIYVVTILHERMHHMDRFRELL